MYATPLAFRQLEQRNAQLPSCGQGTGMGYPAGSNGAFEAWVALPEVRAALNVSGVFPDDAEWGGTAWEYPCEPLPWAHGTAELLAAALALRTLTVCGRSQQRHRLAGRRPAGPGGGWQVG